MRLLVPAAFSLLLLFHSPSFGSQKDELYEINIAKKDSTVRANVFSEKKEIRTKATAVYYWYAYNKIQFTQGGYDGRLLHGAYSCFYSNGNLKQKGRFSNGLKDGEWISWYEDGTIKESVNWKRGTKNGSYKEYDKRGMVSAAGNYSNGLLNGKFIQYDSLKIVSEKQFRKGVEKKPRPKKKKKENSSSRIGSDEGEKKKKPGFHLFNREKPLAAVKEKNTKKDQVKKKK